MLTAGVRRPESLQLIASTFRVDLLVVKASGVVTSERLSEQTCGSLSFVGAVKKSIAVLRCFPFVEGHFTQRDFLPRDCGLVRKAAYIAVENDLCNVA